MTNKTTMPDPDIFDGVRMGGSIASHGHSVANMEAYANARVRQALEEAATVCWEMQSKPEYGKDDKDRWLAVAEQRIRALIPKD